LQVLYNGRNAGHQLVLLTRAVEKVLQSGVHTFSKKLFSLRHHAQTILGTTQPPIQWILGPLIPAVKRPGREPDHSHPSSA